MTLTEFLTARIANDERGYRATYGGHYRSEDLLAFDLLAFHLAECEAKRRILDDLAAHLEADYEAMESPIASAGWHAKTRTLNGVVRLLALPYADHPDYDEAWRV